MLQQHKCHRLRKVLEDNAKNKMKTLVLAVDYVDYAILCCVKILNLHTNMCVYIYIYIYMCVCVCVCVCVLQLICIN